MKKERIKIGIIINPRKEKVVKPLTILDEWCSDNTQVLLELTLCTFDSPYLEQKKFNSIRIESLQKLIDTSEMILSLGGDGTLLRTVQLIGERGIPIMGINLGGLGFLADTTVDELLDHLQNFLKGKYVTESRSLLQCKVLDSSEVYFALNDFVIDKAGFSRVIEIVTHVDDYLLNYYIADGLILSTPTGSTAYSLSAGGPIVVPQTRVFIINPICPHSLTNRPVVISDESRIRLKVFTEFKEIKLFRDGQLIRGYPSGTEFQITRAPFEVKLIRMQKLGFYDTLRNKLRWGEDFRNKKRWGADPGDSC